jgi:hypothetical protein
MGALQAAKQLDEHYTLQCVSDLCTEYWVSSSISYPFHYHLTSYFSIPRFSNQAIKCSYQMIGVIWLSTTDLQRVLRLYWTVSPRLYCFIIYMCSVKYEVSATLFDICLPSFDYLCKQHVLTFCYNHLSFDFVNRDNIASSRKVSRRYQEGIIMNRSVDQDNRSGLCPWKKERHLTQIL